MIHHLFVSDCTLIAFDEGKVECGWLMEESSEGSYSSGE